MLEKIKEKISNKNLLPLILFFIVLINYVPLIVLNINTKESFPVPVKLMVIAMGIECLILMFYYFNKIIFTKETVMNFILLVVVTIVSIIIQIISYINNDYEIFDFANIACKFINVLFLFVFVLNLKIEEKYINTFMKGILCMGIIACIQNVILYFEDILIHLNLIEATKFAYPCKSFFSQKNPFAVFLFVSIVANIFLFQKKNTKPYQVFLMVSFIFLWFNLILTFSRTGTAIAIIFLGLWFLLTNKIKIKFKIIIVVIGIIALVFGIILLKEYNPDLIDRLLRLESIKTFTGRTVFWDLAEEELGLNNVNTLFGIGRFKAERLIEKYNVTQFHNTYVEFLVSGGILELLYFISLYLIIIIKLFRSEIEWKYKAIYLAMFVSYVIYMCFESLGRFSIGCSDTLCLIFFVTIPLLHANSILNQEDIESIKNEKIEKLETRDMEG